MKQTRSFVLTITTDKGKLLYARRYQVTGPGKKRRLLQALRGFGAFCFDQASHVSRELNGTHQDRMAD